MNIRPISTAILFFCSILLVNAQSKDILAKAAMLNADDAYNKGQYVDCLSFLMDAETNLGATNSRIQYLMVKSWMAVAAEYQDNKGYLSKAEDELEIFFEVTPENGYIPEKYEEMLLAVGQIKKSIAKADAEMINICNNAIERDRTNVFAYFSRAQARDNLKDYQGAIQDYNKYIEINPNEAFIYIMRATTRNNLKDYQGAISDYSKYIELNPTEGYVYAFRAIAKDRLQDYQGAIKDFTKSIEIDSNNTTAYFERGKIYQNKMKDIQSANKDFKKIIFINDNDKRTVALSKYYLGDKGSAYNLLNTRLKDVGVHKSEQQSIHYGLACLYSMDGNQIEALKSLKNALEKGYNNYSSIEDDEDIDNIRNSPEFKELINTYKSK
jgi:tetratricopeptide (TPR) repeat protein